MAIVAMIPARYGSKRLPRKNLRLFDGVSLLEFAIIRAQAVFENAYIWVNGDHDDFKVVAERCGVNYYPRPARLGDDSATSEDFVFDFMQKVECKYLVQIHTITPLLSPEEIKRFNDFLREGNFSTVLSGFSDRLESMYQGVPINFSFLQKTNSQDLNPIFRITWPISAWHKETFLEAKKNGEAGTYSGEIGYFEVDSTSGIPIKTQADFDLVKAIYALGRNH